MSELLFDKKDAVGIVTLNRPDNMNALTFGMIKGLISYFQDAEQDDSIRAVVLTGNGRAFCTGADLVSGAGRTDMTTAMGMKLSAHLYGRVFFSMANCEKPIVNAINGTAAGAGVNIALGGDIIVAARGDQAHRGLRQARTRPGRRGMLPPAPDRGTGQGQGDHVLR